MTATLTTHAILVKARNRIASKWRWRKDYYATPRATNYDTCGVCSLGALGWASSGNPYHLTDGGRKAEAALARAMEAMGKGTFVVEFNDRPDTTHADVLAAFDAAIAATAVPA